jgi:hypothetical protein
MWLASKCSYAGNLVANVVVLEVRVSKGMSSLLGLDWLPGEQL